MTTYTVKKGDTLGKIAHKCFGDILAWRELAKYNNLQNPHLLKVGQILEILPWMPRRFTWPMQETETNYYRFGSTYGPGPHEGKPHPGVDFHEAEWAPVYAVADGIFRVRRYDKNGYGYYIMIEHRLASRQPIWSLYAHLQAWPEFKIGEWVQGSNCVGHEGQSGATNIPHLHFEIKRIADLGLYPSLTWDNYRQFYWDPYSFLSKQLFLPVHCWGCPRCAC